MSRSFLRFAVANKCARECLQLLSRAGTLAAVTKPKDVRGKHPLIFNLHSETMTSFFQGLMENILRIFWSQYSAAQDRGHMPDVFFLCGGPARNKWFTQRIFYEIQQRKPEMTCVAETQ